MAGRGAFAKLSVTRPEGNIAAGNAVLHAARVAGEKVRAAGGSEAEAIMAARAAARATHPDTSRSKAAGAAAHARFAKARAENEAAAKKTTETTLTHDRSMPTHGGMNAAPKLNGTQEAALRKIKSDGSDGILGTGNGVSHSTALALQKAGLVTVTGQSRPIRGRMGVSEYSSGRTYHDWSMKLTKAGEEWLASRK